MHIITRGKTEVVKINENKRIMQQRQQKDKNRTAIYLQEKIKISKNNKLLNVTNVTTVN
ncbi:MAG: hypothetical protein JJW01_00545 [Alphaproteobacteria bacterium]|nr:hypothetical protein [Rickettsiales bacterium]